MLSVAQRALLQRGLATTAAAAAGPRIAVVLAGSGVYDGSEVHEASAVMVHLSRHNAATSLFAPDMEQMHVVDHSCGAPVDGEVRNVLAESARIARGNIQPLSALNAADYDGLIVPGGFGAAKNLSNFAVNGDAMTVHPEVDSILKAFHEAKKPLGLCCIAPVLAAKAIPGCTVTVGSDEEGPRWPYAGTAGAIEAMGSNHAVRDVSETCIDEENNLVTTPAFMCETKVRGWSWEEVFGPLPAKKGCSGLWVVAKASCNSPTLLPNNISDPRDPRWCWGMCWLNASFSMRAPVPAFCSLYTCSFTGNGCRGGCALLVGKSPIMLSCNMTVEPRDHGTADKSTGGCAEMTLERWWAVSLEEGEACMLWGRSAASLQPANTSCTLRHCSITTSGRAASGHLVAVYASTPLSSIPACFGVVKVLLLCCPLLG